MTGAGASAVLVVNPGGSSTKVALFRGEELVADRDVRHGSAELARFERVVDQIPWRSEVVRGAMREIGVDEAGLDAVVGRGGPVAPVPGGVFAVCSEMLAAIREGRVMVEHPSLLGAPLAREVADRAGCPAFVVDPVSVDELADEARLTGIPSIERRSLNHALSIRASAREAAARLGRPLGELDLIVLHLGSGFSVAAHGRGRQVDATDASASGPMSPTRAGSVPAFAFADLCFSGEVTLEEVRRLLVGEGGWVAHLGTDDIREIYRRVDAGDARARLVLDATVLQIAKETAAMAAALGGSVDAVVITGGVARSERFAGEVTERIAWLGGERVVLPGENEMLALARGALSVLAGETEARAMGPYIDGTAKERS